MNKGLYSEFLQGKENEIHFTGHSHHFWPNVTRDAVLKSWEDSCLLADQKWEHFFSNIVPETRRLISSIINLSNPSQIAFAPNTHELLFRLLSCLLEKDKVRILTTDSEFHSFDRQLQRLAEWNKFEVTKINQDDPDFEKKLSAEAANQYDLIFVSHVFYNSGKVLSEETLQNLCETKSEKSLLIIDGYHSYCALPIDWSKFENKAFYLAGSYKYAQAGEGLCFMTIPKDLDLRPLNTGWFAHFESLTNKPSVIKYSEGGDGFWGATQDMTPFYRFNFVWNNFKDNNINIKTIHDYVVTLQDLFAHELHFKDATLLNPESPRAHFLAYRFKSPEIALKLESYLIKNNVFTDRRNAVLRFGFAPYLDKEQILKVIKLIKSSEYC